MTKQYKNPNRVYKHSFLQGRDFVREQVRIRDNYTCQKCKKIWNGKERRFDVHHLNGLCGKKSTGYDSIKDIGGLITLCHKCHLTLDSVKQKMFYGKKIDNNKAIKEVNKIKKLREKGLTFREIALKMNYKNAHKPIGLLRNKYLGKTILLNTK